MTRLVSVLLVLSLSACAAQPQRPQPAPNASHRVVYMDLYVDPDAEPMPVAPPEAPAAAPAAVDAAPSAAPLDSAVTTPVVGFTDAETAPVVAAVSVSPPPPSTSRNELPHAVPTASPVIPALAGEPVPAEPPYVFSVNQGEFARNALERWCTAHDVRLVWQAPFDIPLIADANFPVHTLREAVSQLLRAVYHPRAPLIAEEHPNNVLVIRQP